MCDLESPWLRVVLLVTGAPRGGEKFSFLARPLRSCMVAWTHRILMRLGYAMSHSGRDNSLLSVCLKSSIRYAVLFSGRYWPYRKSRHPVAVPILPVQTHTYESLHKNCSAEPASGEMVTNTAHILEPCMVLYLSPLPPCRKQDHMDAQMLHSR